MQAGQQIKTRIGRNIRQRREELRLSRLALSPLLGGVDPTLIYKWEKGLHRPTDGNLAALSQALDRDVAWFYTDHETTGELAA